jgi:hypothetical protein
MLRVKVEIGRKTFSGVGKKGKTSCRAGLRMSREGKPFVVLL